MHSWIPRPAARSHLLGALVMLGTLAVTGPAAATVETFNAEDDFSITTQGYRNWYYLDWTGVEYVDMTYGTNWWGFQSWHGSCPGECSTGCTDSVLQPATVHTNICGHAPTRAWVSPALGYVDISGNARKVNVGGGDGVRVEILKNESLLWSRVIAFNDNVGFNFDMTVFVQPGDTIYFRVFPRNNPLYDSTFLNPTVILDTELLTPVILEDDKITASDASAGDLFGAGLALEGDLAVAGADHFHLDASIGAGAAYVYRLTEGVWVEEAILVPDDHGPTDGFGFDVGISGDVIVVAAPWASVGTNRGAVYVFRHDGTTWNQEAKLASTVWLGWGFGVDIDGDVIAIGATGDDDAATNAGAVHIFRYDGTSWNEEAKLTASDGGTGDALGRNVSIDGNAVVAGAWTADGVVAGSGAAYVFRYDTGTWSEDAKLIAPSGSAGDRFSSWVSIDRDAVLVGARFNDDVALNAGSAYVFRYDGSAWNLEAQLNPSDAAAGDSFGHTASICRNVAVVANVQDDDSGSASGSAYIYVYDGISWNETAKLLASDGSSADLLGARVAACENALLAARREDSAEFNAGAVYYYAFPDGDGDGLNDYHELFYGTGPADADSDDDGLVDGTEIDVAEDTGCPDALNADSDGDMLNDGDEVEIGTDPCNSDTDADLIPDAIDPFPLDPEGTSGFIEDSLRNLCDYINGLELSLIDAKNNNARAGRQNAMCNKVGGAANLVAAEAYQDAIDQIESLLAKIDGDSHPKDWMVESNERDVVRDELETMIALLEFLP